MGRPDLEHGRAVRLTALAAALLVPVLGPSGAEGQQEDGPETTVADTAAVTDTVSAADTAESVTYMREVFTYPAGARPNPFEPPQVGGGAGPRFGDMSLAGLIYAPEIGSVAILTDGSTGKRHRVRDGDRLGNFRIVEIRREEVVFSVQGATGPRREVLQATRDEEEENP